MTKTAKPANPFAEAVEAGAILLVDKASGWTSHDVVARARRVFGTRKIGHAGTLDPLATGLLTLGIGPATRLLTHMVGLDKVYTATVRLGQATVTDDSEGEIRAVADPEKARELAVDPAPIFAAAQQLTGEIAQVPTKVSAIKVAGKRAYDLVREGAEVELAARQVTVYSFELAQPRLAQAEGGEPVLDIDVRVRVSSGTYVRALARDLGEITGIFGHLTALRRESVGPFAVADALPNEILSEQAEAVRAGGVASPDVVRVFSPAEVAASLFGGIKVSAQQAQDLAHGKQPAIEAAEAELAAAIAPCGRLVALVRVRDGKARVVTGFPPPAGGFSRESVLEAGCENDGVVQGESAARQ
ncbi:MAG: tRNA pseudouridine(55) synthase TruB [Microbacteriaceae bacterium]|nr:tRNA pseudouridine(55) synthase TruB [Microbacteriaceae bacterium]